MINENQWRIYQDKDNSWHWKYMAPAGQILKNSVLSYKTRIECLDNARKYGYQGS